MLCTSCTNDCLVWVIYILCFSESCRCIIMVIINLLYFTIYLHAKSCLFSVSWEKEVKFQSVTCQ